jgi:hypothetical protein
MQVWSDDEINAPKCDAVDDHRIWGSSEPSSGSTGCVDESSGSHNYRRGEVRRILEKVDVQSVSDVSVSSENVLASRQEGRSASLNGSLPEDIKVDANRQNVPNKIQWSVGSKFHSLGTCKPCSYNATKIGCQNGEACTFCHLEHEKVKRPWKAKRAQCRKLAEQLDNASECNLQQIMQVAESDSARGSYMRSVVKGKLRNQFQHPSEKEGEKDAGAKVDNDRHNKEIYTRPLGGKYSISKIAL